jgi:hypothetical protein
MATTKSTTAKKTTPKAAAKKTTVTGKATAKTVATKKPAPKASKPAAAKKPAAPAKKPAALSPEQRYKMVQDAAYFIAEKNGFKAGSMDYWIAAEVEITALLSGMKK